MLESLLFTQSWLLSRLAPCLSNCFNFFSLVDLFGGFIVPACGFILNIHLATYCSSFNLKFMTIINSNKFCHYLSDIVNLSPFKMAIEHKTSWLCLILNISSCVFYITTLLFAFSKLLLIFHMLLLFYICFSSFCHFYVYLLYKVFKIFYSLKFLWY